MRKTCSCDRENFLKYEAEGREFAKNLRSLEQFVRTVKGQINFLRSNELEQLEFKLEKIIGI